MERKYTFNPYVAGVLLALVLLASYALLGTGLGASSAPARLAASWFGTSPDGYFATLGAHPLHYYLVTMFAGIFLGGSISAWSNRRVSLMLERGRSASTLLRAIYAFGGGILCGWASRVAQGCTSGQGLSGAAQLAAGSFVFLGSMFAAGYLGAFLFGRQWHD